MDTTFLEFCIMKVSTVVVAPLYPSGTEREVGDFVVYLYVST